MYVYLDVLIIQNLVMNYIILWVTYKFSKETTTFLKLFLSALIGSLYATIVFFPSLKVFYTIIFKILISFVLVVIAFHPYKLRQFIKVLSVFYIVSFVFGGAAFGLFYFTNFGVIISNGVFYISNFPVKILIISTIISFFVIKYSWSIIQNKLSKENMMAVINVFLGEKQVNVKALLDTANNLYDPISNYPVIVVEFEAVKELLPLEIKEIFENSKENDYVMLANIMNSSQWINRFRVIPFTSLGKENGMLVGFKPDKILVEDIQKTKKIKDIIIAIYNKKLSKDESYNALMHPEIINF